MIFFTLMVMGSNITGLLDQLLVSIVLALRLEMTRAISWLIDGTSALNEFCNSGADAEA